MDTQPSIAQSIVTSSCCLQLTHAQISPDIVPDIVTALREKTHPHWCVEVCVCAVHIGVTSQHQMFLGATELCDFVTCTPQLTQHSLVGYQI